MMWKEVGGAREPSSRAPEAHAKSTRLTRADKCNIHNKWLVGFTGQIRTMVIILHKNNKKKTNKLVYLCFWSSFISLIPCGLEPKITGEQNKQPQVKTVVILFDADWSDYTILLMQTGFWSVPVLPITIPLWFCVTRRISGLWKPSVASCRNLLIVLVLLCSIALSYKLPVC